MLFFFFFQAEDGIRDKLVTGVQTCALPISSQRKPRILMSSKAEPEPRAEPEAAVAAPEISQATTERAATIPGSEHRRIRTLVTYGMTPEQVAGLYEASLNEVRRIIGNREARKKA